MAANSKPSVRDRALFGFFVAVFGFLALLVFAEVLGAIHAVQRAEAIRAEPRAIWDPLRSERSAKWKELRARHSAEWVELCAKHRSEWEKCDTAKQESDDAFWEAVRVQIHSPDGVQNAEWNAIRTKREEEWDSFRAEFSAIRAKQSAEVKATLAQQEAELEATLNHFIKVMSKSNWRQAVNAIHIDRLN